MRSSPPYALIPKPKVLGGGAQREVIRPGGPCLQKWTNLRKWVPHKRTRWASPFSLPHPLTLHHGVTAKRPSSDSSPSLLDFPASKTVSQLSSVYYKVPSLRHCVSAAQNRLRKCKTLSSLTGEQLNDEDRDVTRWEFGEYEPEVEPSLVPPQLENCLTHSSRQSPGLLIWS
jgi:hypothetical protein